jgi:hypothetical protein
MRKLALLLLTAAGAFLVGIAVVRIIGLQTLIDEPPEPANEEMIYRADEPLAVVEVEKEASIQPTGPLNPLDAIWVEEDHSRYGNVTVNRECKPNEAGLVTCKLIIRENGRVRKKFEIEWGNKWWLRFGWYDLLGNGKKQLIVHRFSGGANCCYDYSIYEVTPRFRELYDSLQPDDVADWVGDELFPIDLDGDGVLEFRRNVMAGSYLSPSGRATSAFPPAWFAFDNSMGRYVPANKKFTSATMDELDERRKQLNKWRTEIKEEDDITPEFIDEVEVRHTFLYLVYAGKKDEAWKYFDENYHFEFREKFRNEFKQAFAEDPTYRSLYGRRRR